MSTKKDMVSATQFFLFFYSSSSPLLLLLPLLIWNVSLLS
jgi:hypothetical protein